jgi:hypothetical protein
LTTGVVGRQVGAEGGVVEEQPARREVRRRMREREEGERGGMGAGLLLRKVQYRGRGGRR